MGLVFSNDDPPVIDQTVDADQESGNIHCRDLQLMFSLDTNFLPVVSLLCHGSIKLAHWVNYYQFGKILILTLGRIFKGKSDLTHLSFL